MKCKETYKGVQNRQSSPFIHHLSKHDDSLFCEDNEEK